MFERRYFVYMLQSASRRALYIGFANFLIGRTMEHRTGKYSGSFTERYRVWRLVYYEEYGDVEAAKDRERQLKGWSRAKKESLVMKVNPKWQDLISEWEEKFGLEFRVDDTVLKDHWTRAPEGKSKANTRSFDSGIPRPPH